MEGFEASKLEDVGEQMMEDMVAQFENLGEREDYNEVFMLEIEYRNNVTFHNFRLSMVSCDSYFLRTSCMNQLK